MASSKTAICNLALLRMGEQRINDITEDSPTARICNEIFDQLVDEVLAMGPQKGWKFALTRLGAIGVDSTAPDFEYEYRFSIPAANLIKITLVSVDGIEITDWVREGDYILTNQESEEIDYKYVQRITDVSKYPPHFVRVLALRLAVELTYRISQDLNKVRNLQEELYSIVLPKAIAIDNQENYVKESSSSWVDAGRTTTIIE